MFDHLGAARAVLEAKGWRVFLVDADPTRLPYVLLAPGYSTPGERPLSSDLTGVVDTDIRVTCAGETAESVLGLRAAVVDVLCPGAVPHRLTVPGRVATLEWLRHETTAVDRDVTLPGSNRHPMFSVDTFRLVSQPTPAA